MSHAYYIFPLHFRMPHLQFLCNIIGCLTDNLNVLYHCIKEYLILAKVIKCLAFKEILNISDSC